MFQNTLTEPIKKCSISPSLPPGLTLNQSDCSVTGNLLTPFNLSSHVLVMTTETTNYIGNLNISSKTRACDQNSSTIRYMHGTGLASFPYIICNSSQFFEYLQKPSPLGYANIQADLELGNLSSSLGSLDGAIINGMGHSISFNINTNNNDISLFQRIDNSSLSRLKINGSVTGIDKVSILTNIIGINNVITNLYFPNTSSVIGHSTSILSSYIEPNSQNIISDIIIGTAVNSSVYHPYVLVYPDLTTESINNILFFDLGNSGLLINYPYIPIQNKSFFNDSKTGINSIFTQFNFNYWIFDRSSHPSLIKTRMLIYE
jgi:hypothetical protein